MFPSSSFRSRGDFQLSSEQPGLDPRLGTRNSPQAGRDRDGDGDGNEDEDGNRVGDGNRDRDRDGDLPAFSCPSAVPGFEGAA